MRSGQHICCHPVNCGLRAQRRTVRMRRRAEEHDLSPVWSSSLSQQHKQLNTVSSKHKISLRTNIYFLWIFELLINLFEKSWLLHCIISYPEMTKPLVKHIFKSCFTIEINYTWLSKIFFKQLEKLDFNLTINCHISPYLQDAFSLILEVVQKLSYIAPHL